MAKRNRDSRGRWAKASRASGSVRTSRAFLGSFLRCYLGGACFNTRGYLNIGLSFAMFPGLGAIHTDPAAFQEAKRRYVRHFHTHPFWLPCLVGIFLSAERLIAAKQLPPAMLEKIKDTTSYTLSAIGDSLFAGSLLIFWALTSVCMLLAGYRALPLAFGLVFFFGLQCFRAYTFWAGLRQGFSMLERLKRWNLINWGRRIKYVNAGLMLLVWVLVFPRPIGWEDWVFGIGGISLFSRLFHRRIIPREIVVVVFIALTVALPWLAGWVKELAWGVSFG